MELVKNAARAYLTDMKRVIALAILLGFSALVLRAEEGKTNAPAKSAEPVKIKAEEAKKHIGEEAVVSGTVAEVNRAASLVRLNFEKPYPNNVFAAVIFNRNTNAFPEVDKLKGKSVEVSGKVADYHGRPEIVVNSANQVKVIEKEEKGDKDKAEKKTE
jgi:DNA/RNA endonuclease YhcR with UshA esterase domain